MIRPIFSFTIGKTTYKFISDKNKIIILWISQPNDETGQPFNFFTYAIKSSRDQFSYRVGCSLALSRLFQQFQVTDREQRKLVFGVLNKALEAYEESLSKV